MTDQTKDETSPARMSDRYAALAAKSAAEAEAAARRAGAAAELEDARATKGARREAKDWCEQATLDAMRAHGALAAETGQFEATHDKATGAASQAALARDRAAEFYRKLKSGPEPTP
jgi:hypothetical protein